MTYEDKVKRAKADHCTVGEITYINGTDEITVEKNGEFLGYIWNEHHVIDSVRIPKDISGKMRYELRKYSEEKEEATGISEISNYDLIAFGADPIAEDWEDGHGHSVSADGWGPEEWRE